MTCYTAAMRRAILFLTLLLCGFSPAPEDVSGWSFVVSKGAESGITTVAEPVRDGASAIKFVMTLGHCTEDDCDHDRERIELKQTEYQHEGESWWYAWSFYVPGDSPDVWPVREFAGQFHQEGGEPAMLFSIEPKGLMFESRFHDGKKALLVPADELKGRWHDMVVHVAWSHKAGHVTIMSDGKTVVDRAQQTMSEDKVYFKFGLYRAHLSRATSPLPDQTIYYDRLKRGRTESDVTR